jgi:hypothetical protein
MYACQHGAQGLCAGKIFIVPDLLLGFPVSSKGPPYSVASYDIQGNVDNLF